MSAEPEGSAAGPGNGGAELAPAALHEQIEQLEARVQLAEERRRALVHIMGDLNESNQKLADQRKAMLHILGDYENDRSRLARQTERLDNSRRGPPHILQDQHQTDLPPRGRPQRVIHIHGDLPETVE